MKPRQVVRAVDSKVPNPEVRNSKEQNRWAIVDGKRVLRVTLPKVHASDIKAGTLNSIRKQLHLDSDNFEAFVDCSMSATDYLAHLRALIVAGAL